MNAKTKAAIQKHGEQLLAIFPQAVTPDPVALCRRLHQLEAKAQAIALRLCNGPEFPGGYDEVDRLTDGILAKVRLILGYDSVLCHVCGEPEFQPHLHTGSREFPPILLCRDPRGYSLKIDDAWMQSHPKARLHTDRGGYGIIAPDLTA